MLIYMVYPPDFTHGYTSLRVAFLRTVYSAPWKRSIAGIGCFGRGALLRALLYKSLPSGTMVRQANAKFQLVVDMQRLYPLRGGCRPHRYSSCVARYYRLLSIEVFRNGTHY